MIMKATMSKLLGWKTHSKRSAFGHWFRNGKCLECGLAKSEFDKRYKHVTTKDA